MAKIGVGEGVDMGSGMEDFLLPIVVLYRGTLLSFNVV
jgi:hypothetical protein